MKKDIYFDINYGKLYETMENGKAEIFEYEDDNGKVSNQFILRKIPTEVDGIQYFDIVYSIWVWGDQYWKIIKKVKKEDLINEYYKNF